MRQIDSGEKRLLLRVEEAAALLGVGRTTVYAMVSAQKLPIVRIGRSVRIPRDGLVQWIRDHIDGDRDDSGVDSPAYAIPRVRYAFRPPAPPLSGS
jgi:excisionase family DNA binding protein